MNQQRSRRFRTAQEARDKEEARIEALALWKGKLGRCTPAQFLKFLSNGQGSLRKRTPEGTLGLERYHPWNPIHGPPCFLSSLLGCSKAKH